VRRALVLIALAACGGPKPQAQLGDPSTGANQWVAEQCLGCHEAVAAQWMNPSSHRLLLDCSACHAAVPGAPDGPDHQTTVSCKTCHAARSHRSFGCVTCHDVHGSPNLFDVKPVLYGKAVHLTKAEGATPDGLAHQGQGVCETCHERTKYYSADGGLAHDATYCVECHTHFEGFTP
jgi:hypothetical protein